MYYNIEKNAKTGNADSKYFVLDLYNGLQGTYPNVRRILNVDAIKKPAKKFVKSFLRSRACVEYQHTEIRKYILLLSEA